MQIPCPNCNQLVEQLLPPSRDNPNAGEAWACVKCPAVICVNCYVQHNQGQHPELYQPQKRPTEGGKKNRKHRKQAT